jgi:hypothetical protein
MLGGRDAIHTLPDTPASPWKDIYTFIASDWSGTSDNWYDTTRRYRFTGMLSVAVKEGDLISIPSEPQASVASFAGYNIPIVFRVLLDAVDVTISSSHNTILLDNSIGTVGSDGHRGFALGYGKSGAAYVNWKMNGNNTSSIFNPTTRIKVFSPPQVVSGIFECGVRPEDDGLACYTAFNGEDNSVGPVVYESDFGQLGYLQSLYLFRSMVQGHGAATGKIRSLRIQAWEGFGL